MMPLKELAPKRKVAVLALLREARALVARPNGWCQGELWNAQGAVSLVGSFYVARPGFGTRILTLRRDACRLVIAGLDDCDANDYNDEPDRTQEDIVQLFDKAIARLEPSLS